MKEDIKVIIDLDRFHQLLALEKLQEEQKGLNKKIFVKHLTILVPILQKITSNVSFDWESLDFNRDPLKVVFDEKGHVLKFIYYLEK